jgi:hypothetical protein
MLVGMQLPGVGAAMGMRARRGGMLQREGARGVPGSVELHKRVLAAIDD